MKQKVETNHPLSGICDLWINKIDKARKRKKSEFGDVAEECWKFFNSAHDFMYESDQGTGVTVDGGGINTKFRFTMNKVAELVQLFGPVMYNRNPHRQVNPSKPSISPQAIQFMLGNYAEQAMQQISQSAANDTARGELLEWVLNYLPNEFHLKSHSRRCIDEAMIKGRGCMWHSIHRPEGSEIVLPKTEYDSVDNLLIDPDATSLEDATWIARWVVEPKHIVARRFGIDEDLLPAGMESSDREATINTSLDGKHWRSAGITYDLIGYYEVYSKSGMGQYFSESRIDFTMNHPMDKMRPILEQFGDYVYLAVCEDCDFPLNLPPDAKNAKERLRWPIPFWADNGAGCGWPVSVLDFHTIPGKPWPQAHMKPGLGELRFLNWAMSFLMGRMHATSRQIIAYAEHLDEEVKDAIENGEDLVMIAVKKQTNQSVRDLIEVIQMPPLNSDMWNVIAAVMELFDKRVGLTELVYGLGGQKQIRSASEANIRREQVSVRPDDMADIVEDHQSLIARREAQILRWFTAGDSVSEIFREEHNPQENQIGPFSHLWDKLVSVPLNHDDPKTISTVVREFDFRIEAGSVRKPNRERDVANMDQSMQVIMPLLTQYYQSSGDVEPVNAILTQWAKVRDIDISQYLLKPAPPPDPQQLAAQATSEGIAQLADILKEYLMVSGDPSGINALLEQWAQSRNLPPIQLQPLQTPPESGQLDLMKITAKGQMDQQRQLIANQKPTAGSIRPRPQGAA